MSEISIQINWIYFLGIMGALIGIAWYSGGRFTKIETDVEWIKKDIDWIKGLLKDLKIITDNKNIEAFEKGSPIELTSKGEKFLEESGLKKYINDRTEDFILKCKSAKDIYTAYDIQEYVFNLMDEWKFDIEFEKKLKNYSFKEGMELDIMRRIGGIYLRNICLSKMNLDKQDIDKHLKEQAK